jgi:hypothetical protein
MAAATALASAARVILLTSDPEDLTALCGEAVRVGHGLTAAP